MTGIFKNDFLALVPVGVMMVSQQETRRLYDSLKKMNAGVKHAFGTVKDEMTQHLDAINQNTNEIQACYEYLAELDAKFDKLAERMDALQFQLEPEEAQIEISLTHREQEVFMILYVQEDPITAVEIAKRLGLTVEMVDRYLLNIASKGVPVLKTFVNGKVYHSLDLKFKDLQARKNVLNINESVSAQLLTEKAI